MRMVGDVKEHIKVRIFEDPAPDGGERNPYKDIEDILEIVWYAVLGIMAFIVLIMVLMMLCMICGTIRSKKHVESENSDTI